MVYIRVQFYDDCQTVGIQNLLLLLAIEDSEAVKLLDVKVIWFKDLIRINGYRNLTLPEIEDSPKPGRSPLFSRSY